MTILKDKERSERIHDKGFMMMWDNGVYVLYNRAEGRRRSFPSLEAVDFWLTQPEPKLRPFAKLNRGAK